MIVTILRYTKIIFIGLRLHILFGWLNKVFGNLYYLTKFSKWALQNKNIAYNDFPCKWDYTKRNNMYAWVIEKEKLNTEINYIEFGVAAGNSFKWWLQQNTDANSMFYGFDTFEGLPEDWGHFKKGAFSNKNNLPEINDKRGKFFKGLFQETLPKFLKELDGNKKNVIMMDADLYTATLFALTSLAPFLKKDDIIFFDEFVVPMHEFKAFLDFTESYYIQLELIAASNNYYFTAFKVV